MTTYARAIILAGMFSRAKQRESLKEHFGALRVRLAGYRKLNFQYTRRSVGSCCAVTALM